LEAKKTIYFAFKEKLGILWEASEIICKLLTSSLRDDMIITICRLTEDGKKNSTISQLHEDCKEFKKNKIELHEKNNTDFLSNCLLESRKKIWDIRFPELESEIKKLKKDAESLKKIRDKVIAHRDVTILQSTSSNAFRQTLDDEKIKESIEKIKKIILLARDIFLQAYVSGDPNLLVDKHANHFIKNLEEGNKWRKERS
jgi:hypothetical protein